MNHGGLNLKFGVLKKVTYIQKKKRNSKINQDKQKSF